MNPEFAKNVGKELAADTVSSLSLCDSPAEISRVIIDALNALVLFEPTFRREVVIGFAETITPLLESGVKALWSRGE